MRINKLPLKSTLNEQIRFSEKYAYAMQKLQQQKIEICIIKA